MQQKTLDDSIDGLGPWRAGAIEGFEPFPDSALEGSLAQRFTEIAQRFADHRALSSPAGVWTYSQLDEWVRVLSGGLVERVGCDRAVVGLIAGHDGPLVALMLAVISSGNVLVVIDPAAPEDQQRHVLAESGASLVVHDSDHAGEAARLVAAVHDVGRSCTTVDLDALPGDPLEPVHAGPTTPMMLAFTSGTSGAPKAAVITHGVVLNVVRGATNALGVGPDDRMPMLFPTSLAVAAYPLFIPLLNGGTLATLDVRSVGLEPVPDFLERERITLAYMAPTVIRFLVDALAGRSFPDVRMIALGGELVDADVMTLTADLFEPDHLAVGYGTTESGVVSLHVQASGVTAEGAIPCGHAVPEVEIVLLGEAGEVMDGGSGEIAIISPRMFLGYKGHPELNRQVLSSDPHGRPGWSMYRTGDFGRFDAAGELVVLGRVDTRVKVRGRPVVLGDIEATLVAHADIADAAVVATGTGGVTELVAYLATGGAAAPDPSELRADLLDTQESYRVPSRFVVLDELPRLPNGKVDRRALPDPDAVTGLVHATDAGGDGGSGAEHDALRRKIRDLWEELLPVGAVGLDEDFNSLGGDSLLAAQMLVMLEQRTGVIVPMGELVHARTIRELAEVVARSEVHSSATTTVAEVQRGFAGRPTLWFVHDLQGSAYRVRHVAAALGADQPVRSFESPLLAGEPNPHRSLDTFAARYLKDLRALQPEGPYWLCGYSFGGICAYEMARQLVADGQTVAFVGVIDVGPGYRGPGWDNRRSPLRPWFGIAKPPSEDSGLRQSFEHYRDMFAASPAGAARHMMVRTGLSRLIDPLRFAADLRRHGRVRPEWRLWYAWEEHWKLAATQWDRSNTYSGDIDLFWAEDSASADATMGWAPLVADLRVHRFPGHHTGALEPQGAPALAQSLRSVMDRRIADRPS